MSTALSRSPEPPPAVADVAVRRLAAADAPAWDAYVAAHPDGSFFHRAGWKTAIEDGLGRDCPFLLAERGGRLAGVLPLVHVKSRLFGNSLISTGFTVGGGPLADDEAALAALDAAAWELAEERDVDYLEYRGASPEHAGWTRKEGLYAGFRKPIEPDPERNMRAIPRKQRAMVRKGIKAGLASEVEHDAGRVWPIYAESVRNLGTPVVPRRYFEALLRVFGADADVVIVLDDGRAVAGVLNFYHRGTVMPYYGGGVAAARARAANDFMYWEVMRRACERGLREFDFGRSKFGTGAFSFKKNWGFEPEPWSYAYRLRRLEAVPDVNPLNPKYRLFIAAWQRLPLALANRLGPVLARQLG